MFQPNVRSSLSVATMFSSKVLAALVLLFGAVSGCNRPPMAYVVHGMVIFPDGKPLTKGTVEFEAIGQRKPITASGQIAKDGTFQLGTFQPGDGAISGQHRVAVIVDYDIGTGVERPQELPPPELHPRFRSFKTSGLKYTVEPRMNNILVEVEYAPREAKE